MLLIYKIHLNESNLVESARSERKNYTKFASFTEMNYFNYS